MRIRDCDRWINKCSSNGNGFVAAEKKSPGKFVQIPFLNDWISALG